MPRIHQTPRAEIADLEVQDQFQVIFGDRDPVTEPGLTPNGTPGDWWVTLAYSPSIFKIYMTRLRWQRSERRQMRENLMHIMITRAGWSRISKFVFSQHSKGMRSVGLSEDKIREVATGPASEVFDPIERLVLAYADDIALGGRVPESRFDALRKTFDPVALLELTFITASYASSATLCRVLRMEMDDRDDVLADLLPGPITEN